MYGMNNWSNTLQPGFRFHPTDEELIVHYLKQKLSSPSNPILSIIADVNIYKFNPWDLPGKACFGEEEWFFFSPRLKKYPKGTRPNRAAASGYWKATGTDKPIISSVGSQCLGIKKSLVFYKGRPPKGDKTDWMMIEYRLLDDCFPTQRPKESMQLDDWVLCRLRQRSKIGGSRYCDHQSSSCSSSPQGYLQGQDIIAENNILQDNLNKYHQLLAEYQAFDIPQVESEELDENGQMMMDFQESSPDNSQSTIDSNVRNMLKSIERELSVGALDELLPSQPEKTLDLVASSSDQCYANPSVFHISPSFSEF